MHDRGKPNRAESDERRSVQTFETQAQQRGVPGDGQNSYTTRSTAESTTMPRRTKLWETTLYTNVQRGGE